MNLNGRKRITVVTVRRFYKPNQLAEILGMSRNRLMHLAYMCGCIYQVNQTGYLINRRKMEEFISEFSDYVESVDAKYMTTDDAVKELGIPEDSLLQIVAMSGAVYRVGRQNLINVDEVGEYMKKLKVCI